MTLVRILGDCIPALELEAFRDVEDICLLLPCNVLVGEDDAGSVHVDLMDPASVLSLVDHPGIAPLAAQVREKLEKVCDAL